MNIYNIPFNYYDLDVIKHFILKKSSYEKINIADFTVFAPNNLAVSIFHDTFVKDLQDASILPKILSISDTKSILLECLKLTKAECFIDEVLNLLKIPVINENKRAFIVSRLLKSKNQTLHTNEAIKLAFDLANLMDNLKTENININKLQDTSINMDYSNDLFDFIKSAAEHLDKILCELKLRNIFEFKSNSLKLYSKILKTIKSDEQKPIIVFGVNNYFNSMISFLKSIATYNKGSVIFSGINFDIDQSEWMNLEKNHPQYLVSEILKRIDCKRNNIKQLTYNSSIQNSSLERECFIKNIFNKIPNNTLNKNDLEIATKDIHTINCQSDDDEAKLVSLLVKQQLYKKENSVISIITTDLDLSKRIIFELKKFNIECNNSYGIELTKSSNFIFFKLLNQLNLEKIDNILLLSILKHPLCNINQDVNNPILNIAHLINIYLLRGHVVEQSIDNLKELNITLLKNNKIDNKIFIQIESLLLYIENKFSNIQILLNRKTFSFKDMLNEHIKIAEEISNNNGFFFIWENTIGNKLYSCLKEIVENSEYVGDVNLNEYNQIIENLLSNFTVKADDIICNVNIYGFIQSKFINSDLTIIADLNENSFPIIPELSIWHSNYIAEKLSLPLKTEAIGESAYIFNKLCCQQKVILTRSIKKQGAVTTPSRFLIKMNNTLLANSIELNNNELLSLYKLLPYIYANYTKTTLNKISILANPKLENRPKKISVTSIEKLLKNPYIFFIESILKLKPLESLTPSLNKKIYGQLVHKILETLIKNIQITNNINQEYIYTELQKISNLELKPYLINPEILLFWPNRLKHINNELSKLLSSYFKDSYNIISENRSKINLLLNNGTITIIGYADLIINYKNSYSTIIDYKTSNPLRYSNKSIKEYNKQLILLGYMFEKNKFKNQNYCNKIHSLEYWFLPDKLSDNITIKSIYNMLKLDNISQYINSIFKEVEELLNQYLLSSSPLPLNINDKLVNKAYNHFTRNINLTDEELGFEDI